LVNDTKDQLVEIYPKRSCRSRQETVICHAWQGVDFQQIKFSIAVAHHIDTRSATAA
jgi:hypothetical protein